MFDSLKRFLKPDFQKTVDIFLCCLKVFRLFGFSPYSLKMQKQENKNEESYILFRFEKTSAMVKFSKLIIFAQILSYLLSFMLETYVFLIRKNDIITTTEQVINVFFMISTNASALAIVIYLGTKISQFGDILQLLKTGSEDKFFTKSHNETNIIPWHVAYLGVILIVIIDCFVHLYIIYSFKYLFEESDYPKFLMAAVIIDLVIKKFKVMFFITFYGIVCSFGSLSSICFVVLRKYFLDMENNMIDKWEAEDFSRANGSSLHMSEDIEFKSGKPAVTTSGQPIFKSTIKLQLEKNYPETCCKNGLKSTKINIPDNCLSQNTNENDNIKPDQALRMLNYYQLSLNKFIAFPLTITTVYSVFAIIVFLFSIINMRGGSLITSGLIAWIISFSVPVISVYWQADDIRMQVYNLSSLPILSLCAQECHK